MLRAQTRRCACVSQPLALTPRVTSLCRPRSQGITAVTHAVYRALQAVRRRQRAELGATHPPGAGANQASPARPDAHLAGSVPHTEARRSALRVRVFVGRRGAVPELFHLARKQALTALVPWLCPQAVPSRPSRFNLPLAVLSDSQTTGGSPAGGGGREARGGGGGLQACGREDDNSSAAKRQRLSLLPAPSSDHHMAFPQASPLPAPSPGGDRVVGALGIAFPPPSGWAAHTPVPVPAESDDDPMVLGSGGVHAAPGPAQEAAAAFTDGVRPPVTVRPIPLSTAAPGAHILVADTPTTVTTAPEAISDDDEDSGDVWGRGPADGGIAPLDLGITLERVGNDGGAEHGATVTHGAVQAAAAAPAGPPDGGWHIRPGLASQQQLAPNRPPFLASSTQQPGGTQTHERASGWRTAVAATAPLMAPPPLPGSAARGGGHAPPVAALTTTGFGASQGSLAAAWKKPRFAGGEGPVLGGGVGGSSRPGLALSAVPSGGVKSTPRAQHQTLLAKAVEEPMGGAGDGPTSNGRGPAPNQWLVASSAKRGVGQHGPSPAMPLPPHVVEEARRLGLAAQGALPPVTHGAKAVAARQAAAAATLSPHPHPAGAAAAAPQEALKRATVPEKPAVVKLTQPSDESGAAAEWDEAELRGILAGAAAEKPPSGAGEELDEQQMPPLPDAPDPAPPAPAGGYRPDSTEAVVTAAAAGARVGAPAVVASGHVLTFDDVDVKPMAACPVPPPVGLVTDSQENLSGDGSGLGTPHDVAIPAGMVLAPPVVQLLHRDSVVRAVQIAGGGFDRVGGTSSSVGDGAEQVVWTIAVLATSSLDAQGGVSAPDGVLYVWRGASPASEGGLSADIGPWDAFLVGMLRCTLPPLPGDASSWFALSPDGKTLYCLPAMVDAGQSTGEGPMSGGLTDGAAPLHPGSSVSPVGLFALDCCPDKPCGPPGAYLLKTPVPSLRIRAVLHCAHPDASLSPPPTCVTCFRVAEPRNAYESVCVAAGGKGGTCALWDAGGAKALAKGDPLAHQLPVAHVGGRPTDTVVSLCPVRTCASPPAGAAAGSHDGMGPHAACVGTGARLLVGLTAAGQAAAWCMAKRTLLWVAALPGPSRLLQLAPLCCGAAAACAHRDDEAHHLLAEAPPSVPAFTALARVAMGDGTTAGGAGDVVAAHVSFPAATLAPESTAVNHVTMGPPVPLPASPLTVAARGGFAMALLAPQPAGQAAAPQEDRPLGVWHVASGAHVAGLGTADTRCAFWAVEQQAGAAQACVIAAGDAAGRVVVYRLV